MIMCYNFFVGMCSRCSELIQFLTLDYIVFVKDNAEEVEFIEVIRKL